MVVALRPADLARHGPAGALERVHAHDRREQRRPHDLPLTGSLPLEQRGQHARHAVHAGQQVADRDADALGVVRSRSGQRHQTRLPLRDLVVPGPITLGAAVAETADAQHHQPRVEVVHPSGREAEAVEHAGPEVLQQDVGPLDQRGQHRDAVVALQVQRDGLLVAVGRQEVGRLPFPAALGVDERRPPAPGVVTRPGGLDLHDTGAEVAQHHAGVGAGEGAGEVDDEGSVQRSGHPTNCARGRPPSSSSALPVDE